MAGAFAAQVAATSRQRQLTTDLPAMAQQIGSDCAEGEIRHLAQ